MPFKEIYVVNFANGNLHPHLNTNDWPDMVLFPPPHDPNLESEWTFDSDGQTGLSTRRRTVTDETPSAFSRIYVVPPAGSVSINSRLMARVTFDRPLAEGFDADDVLHPIPSLGDEESPHPGGFDPDSVHEPLGEEPSVLSAKMAYGGSSSLQGPSADELSIPELWTVVVSFGPDEDFEETGVHVTCQFNRRSSTGVRLNTPGGFQQGSTGDQADQLESPLNYLSYHGGQLAPNSDLFVAPPLFRLSHSFCGVNANGDGVGHTPGVGKLEIARDWGPSPVSDHRVYSSNTLTDPIPCTSIGALGVTIMIEKQANPLFGIGRVSARLRSFSVLENKPLS